MKVRMQHFRSFVLATGMVALGSSLGCSSSSGPGEVGSVYDTLTTDLSICGQAGRDCLDVIDGNRSLAQTCSDERDSCRDAVSAAKQEVHTALVACRDEARSCVQGLDQDAGRGGWRACKEAFHECVRDAVPPPPLPPCLQSYKECVSQAGDGGPDARGACRDELKACIVADLPPCMQRLAACVEGSGDARACFQEARACRDYRASHDGGPPPP